MEFERMQPEVTPLNVHQLKNQYHLHVLLFINSYNLELYEILQICYPRMGCYLYASLN